ncbi:hypothetical protein SDC9_198676 [bioreactor metagenome]|uniref:Uncharacterized protein n=1 Tax=bioreactor metagenome TaxID=1076179 RepID=A0A645IIC3_9ZZZZ
MKKYRDLYNLIEHDSEAKKYFYSMPDFVREGISERSGNVNSIQSLRDYAENLLRGDG